MSETSVPNEISTIAPRGLSAILRDVPASIVTFLVAVPLSMGIALASGAPIMAGLISAAIGGIVVGALSGVPLQVSGPAAGLAVMVFGYIERFGFKTVCLITMLGGLLQIAFGAARIARMTLAISPAVIHGMLAGIGVQIFLAQLHVVLGGSPQSSAIQNLRQLPGQLASLHGTATVLGLLTIGLLLAWPLLPWKRVRAVPAALVAVVVGTIVSVAFDANVPRVRVPHEWHSAFALPALPHMGQYLSVAVAAFTLAIVASAESLLSAVATDKLHAGPRANLDRELLAQGVGNTLAGMVGGLPVTGVIVRSTANISAGAKTRASTMMHGLWIIVFVTQLGFLINQIPLSVLAGLLCVVGAKLVSPEHIKEMIKHKQASVYFLTLAGVVGINLLAGIGIGVAVAILLLLRRLTRMNIRLEGSAQNWRVRVDGALTFVNVPKLSATLALVPPGASVAVDLNVEVMDHAAWEALHSWRVAHEKTGGVVDMDQLHEAWTPDTRPPRKPRGPESGHDSGERPSYLQRGTEAARA